VTVALFDAQREFEAHGAELLAASERVLRSGHWILGPEVSAFEAEAAAYLDVREAVGVASGSDALILALKTLGVGPGDGVVTTPFTFFATAGAIANVGATPVFADIDPVTLNLDPACVRSVLEGRSTVHGRVGVDPSTIKAVIPVHLFGLPADMADFAAIREGSGVALVEDAAQAFGSTWAGRPVGGIGDIGCFSFFPTKNLGGYGDAGLVVTNSGEHGEQLRLLRAHGARTKYVNEVVGMNSRMDALQAALLRVGLQHLESSLAARRRHASAYDAAFRDVADVLAPPSTSGRTHHQYVISVPDRERVRGSLTRSGVETAVHYPLPLHLHPAFSGLGYTTGDFPISEAASQRVLSLPIFPTMTDEECSAVIRSMLVPPEEEGSEERARRMQASSRS
jgi:dTDP-4-amino-4,6-dideoxygalactose transaminase